MRKIIVPALAAASLLGITSAASAGIWVNGIYIPTCVWTIIGSVCS